MCGATLKQLILRWEMAVHSGQRYAGAFGDVGIGRRNRPLFCMQFGRSSGNTGFQCSMLLTAKFVVVGSGFNWGNLGVRINFKLNLFILKLIQFEINSDNRPIPNIDA